MSFDLRLALVLAVGLPVLTADEDNEARLAHYEGDCFRSRAERRLKSGKKPNLLL